MIYQFKKMTSPQKTQQVTPTSSALSVNKFQRTAKKTNTTPEQTNANSQKTQSILTQEVKSGPFIQKPRTISRTNRVAEKKQSNKSLISQEPSSISIKSRSPQASSPQNLALQQKKSYFSKIQEANNSSIEKQQTKQAQESKINSLKKSQAIFYLICRLKRNTLINVFAKLSQNKKEKKIKNDVQAKLLLMISSQLSKKFEINFYQEFTDKIKIIYSKKSQQSSKIQVQIFQSNFKKTKENLINKLNMISKSKFKDLFDRLKKKMFIKKNILRAAPTLIDLYQKRKIKEAFNILKQISLLASLNKKITLATLSNISKFSQKQQYKRGLMKLKLWTSCQKQATKQLQKVKSYKNIQVSSPNNIDRITQQLTSKIQKIKNQNQKDQKEISALQIKLKKVKKDQENEKKLLQKNIQELKSSKQKNQKEIEQKRSINKQLKIQIESNSIRMQQNTQILTQNDEKLANDKLTYLQKIYFTLSRSQEDDLANQISFISRENKIGSSNSAKALEDWQLLLKKSLLQREINNYQNAIICQSPMPKQQNSITKLMQQQNQMLKTMIRNYIKQRYLWSEVQKYLSSMV